MESHLEARLWNDVFVLAQNELGVPQGTIKATVLIETILAAFEMDEILYELRDHSAGLNCGRWDYIFSCIKKLRSQPDFVLADRGAGHHDHALHARLLAAADQDLPPPRRLRDGRHGGADPDQERSRRQRAGHRQGPRGQGARGHRRPRRHLGRASGPGAGRQGSVRQGHDDARTRSTASATTSTSRPRTCSTSSPRGRSPSRACASTSTSASSTSAPGSPATAACRSTT